MLTAIFNVTCNHALKTVSCDNILVAFSDTTHSGDVNKSN
jgi:hypothetical protein